LLGAALEDGQRIMFCRRDGQMARDGLAHMLGEVPLVGFFCNGEISHDRVYGYTGMLSLFL
jgi:small ligand-binding sensory domain FIST